MKIIGQTGALRYLQEGLKNNHLSPSLLFIGPDGVGKKTVALELLKSLFCSQPKSNPGANELSNCDACGPCLQIEQLNHPDIFFLNRKIQALLLKEKAETQTAIKIDPIRRIDQFLQLKSIDGMRRAALIEEAQLLTPEAANAFLKTLEEPPPQAQLILLVTDEKSLPTTILSRCAQIRFQPIPTADIARWLIDRQGWVEEEAWNAAEMSGGSIGKALTLQSAEAPGELSSIPMDEFFQMMNSPTWRREGKERALEFLRHLIESHAKKLEGGDLSQETNIKKLLAAKRQIEQHVSPRLVLEAVYMQLFYLKKETPVGS